jgi:hypothetical protein
VGTAILGTCLVSHPGRKITNLGSSCEISFGMQAHDLTTLPGLISASANDAESMNSTVENCDLDTW